MTKIAHLAMSAGGWKERAATQLKELASGKYLSKEAIKMTEKGAAGRVPVKAFRAWLVTEIAQRKYRTATTLEATDRKREWELMPQNRETTKVARTSRGTAEQKVRAWVHNQTSGTKKKPHLTPPMVAAMIQSVARRGISVSEVLAAALIVAEEQDITITWRLKTKARVTRDGIQEATAAMQQWGMTAEEVARVTAAAGARVTQLTNEAQTVAIDFGEGWGGAKEGMTRVMTTYGMDTARQYKGVKEGRAVPDLRGDFGAGQGDLVYRTLRKAAVRVDEHRMALFAPNCTEESILQRLEEAQDRGKGPQAGKERSQAQQCAVREVVMGIVQHREREPRWTYVVEQPKGSALAQHPLVLEHLGAPVEARGCCYGYRHSKPTWLWTNLTAEDWTSREFRKGRCTHCQQCNSGTLHEERMTRRDRHDKRPAAGTSTMQGFSKKARWNRMAPDLAESLARGALKRWERVERETNHT